MSFRPPSWRNDLEREIDLIEEVARIHGYEHIPEDRPVAVSSSPRGLRERVESAVRQVLSAAGFDEAVTVSLVEERLAVPVRPGPPGAPFAVDHSSRKRESALRQSLLPSLLAARVHNETHGQPDADLFEIANVYLARPGSALPVEPTHLALVSGGDFRGMKGVIEGLLEGLHVKGATFGTARRDRLFRHRPLCGDPDRRGAPGLPRRDRRRRAFAIRASRKVRGGGDRL